MNVRNTLILIRFATTRSNIIMQSRFFTDADRCIFPKSPSLIDPGGPGGKTNPRGNPPLLVNHLGLFYSFTPGVRKPRGKHVVTWLKPLAAIRHINQSESV